MLNKNKEMLKKGMMQDQFEGYTFEDYDRSTAENTRVYWYFSVLSKQNYILIVSNRFTLCIFKSVPVLYFSIISLSSFILIFLCLVKFSGHYIIIIVIMSEIEPSKVSKLYRSTIFRSYLFGFIGFMIGVKLCDLIFYDPHKHEVDVELM